VYEHVGPIEGAEIDIVVDQVIVDRLRPIAETGRLGPVDIPIVDQDDRRLFLFDFLDLLLDLGGVRPGGRIG